MFFLYKFWHLTRALKILLSYNPKLLINQCHDTPKRPYANVTWGENQQRKQIPMSRAVNALMIFACD